MQVIKFYTNERNELTYSKKMIFILKSILEGILYGKI